MTKEELDRIEQIFHEIPDVIQQIHDLTLRLTVVADRAVQLSNQASELYKEKEPDNAQS